MPMVLLLGSPALNSDISENSRMMGRREVQSESPGLRSFLLFPIWQPGLRVSATLCLFVHHCKQVVIISQGFFWGLTLTTERCSFKWSGEILTKYQSKTTNHRKIGWGVGLTERGRSGASEWLMKKVESYDLHSQLPQVWYRSCYNCPQPLCS